MTPSMIDRAFSFVPVALVAEIDGHLAGVGSDSGNGDTFASGVPLSATGADPVTHRGQDAAITLESTKSALNALVSAYPTCAVYWASAGWTWETALSDAGLQAISPL